ncbi:MAG: nitroreductase family protein [Acidobacteriota bacterium]|nr:nitroreductase family protein [Acidobacteriota bacterium]
MQDKPTNLPRKQFNGAELKSIIDVMLERRATMHFSPEPISDDYLNAILSLATQAPSGYNLQPWRFIVVRKEENRRRLQAVAFNQPKITEAPVVIICLGMKEKWKSRADEVFKEGAKRGAGQTDDWQQARDGALSFITNAQQMSVWVTRHTMIAVTSLMLVAEAYGFDTAPMEGFDPAGVKAEFGIPDEAEVVALIALGHGASEKAYPGRFALNQIVYEETYGEPWKQES